MTLANSGTIASAVDPKVRDYVNARLKEELRPIKDDLIAIKIAISDVRAADERELADIKGLVVKIQSVLQLSRGRVEQIAEKLGDED